MIWDVLESMREVLNTNKVVQFLLISRARQLQCFFFCLFGVFFVN
jgi:hypothetical protein